MKCSKCGSKTKVTDVRHPTTDEVLRRRICTECKHMFYTIEYEAVSNHTFMDYWTKSYRPTTHKGGVKK